MLNFKINITIKNKYFLFNIGSVIALELNAIGFAYSEDSQNFLPVIDLFNKYAEDNDLDITVKFNLISPMNSTVNYEDYITFIKTILNKKETETKYELIFFENTDLDSLSSYFIDLKKLIPKMIPEEHIKEIDPDIIDNYCVADDKLIGLVIYLFFILFYFIS